MNIIHTAIKRWRVLTGQGSFVKNVIIMLSGTAAAQGIGIVLSPLLAHLYTPEQYGELAVYMSILAISVLFGSLGFERAIPMEEDEEHIPYIVTFCFLLLVLLTGVFLAAIILFAPMITDSFRIGMIVYLLPISFFGYGLYNTLNYWALRTRSYGPLARTKWVQGMGGILIQLAAPFVGLGRVGLVLGEVFGRVAGTGTLYTLFHKQFRPGQWARQANWSIMKKMASRYRKIALYVTGSGVFTSMTLQMLPLFMAGYYGLKEAGSIALVDKVLGGPILLLSMSISQVFYAESMKHARENPQMLEQLFRDTFRKLCRIGVVPILVIAVAGPPLFVWLFGTAWEPAAKYVPVYALLYGVNILFSPVSVILESLRLQHWNFWWTVTRFLSLALGLLIVVWLQLSPLAAAILQAVILGVFYLIIYRISAIGIRKRKEEWMNSAATGGTDTTVNERGDRSEA